MGTLYVYLRNLIKSYSIIITLSKRNLINRYAGSVMGIFWAIIQPVMFFGVYWILFSCGFRGHANPKSLPFIVIFLSGYSAWSVFHQTCVSGISFLKANQQLVRKSDFHLEIFPAVCFGSAIIVHCCILGMLFLTMIVYNVGFSLINLQVLYYLFCLFAFCLGVSWFLASLNVFFLDLGYLMSTIFSLSLWVSPIFWDIRLLSHKAQMLLKINPLCYVVTGYKNSFLYHVPFWSDYLYGLYFWGVTIVLLFLGSFVFSKLRPHFVDII